MYKTQSLPWDHFQMTTLRINLQIHQILQPISWSKMSFTVVNSHHIRLESSQKAMVLCKNISFATESTPLICVVDQQILDSLFEQDQYVNLPKP